MLTNELALAVRLVAFKEPVVLKSIPLEPALKSAVAAFKAPLPLTPPATSVALNVNAVPELALRVTRPAKLSFILTVPAVAFAVKLLAFKVPALAKSMLLEPAVRFAVAAFKLAVALMPPAASEAFSVNDVPLLAPRDTRPANVSLILTLPPVAFAVSVLELRDPVVAKSMLLEPAVRLAVAALRAPVALIPPAPLEAFRVKDVPWLAPRETRPANVSVTLTVPPVALAERVLAFSVATDAKSMLLVPAVRIAVAAFRLPVAFIPPAASDAFKVNEVPLLAPRDTRPANVSLMLTVPPVALAVNVLALSVAALAKSMLLVPAVRLALAAFRAPVALIPPAASDAFKVNEVPLLAPRDTRPANVSLILTVPPVAFAVKVLALMEPAPVKSILFEPAVKFAVAAFNAAVPLIPPAASEAFTVNDVPLLAPRLTTPANVSLMFTVPAVAFADSVLALREPVVAKSILPLPAVRLAVPALRTPLAVMPLAACASVKVNELALLAFNVISPFAVFVMVALPLFAVTVRLVAFMEPVVVKSMFPAPAVRSTLAALRAPFAVIPLLTWLSLSLNEVALLAFKVMLPLATSVTSAIPAPFAVIVRLVALVFAITIPAADPDVAVKLAVFNPVTASVDVTFPFTAERVIDVAAL